MPSRTRFPVTTPANTCPSRSKPVASAAPVVTASATMSRSRSRSGDLDGRYGRRCRSGRTDFLRQALTCLNPASSVAAPFSQRASPPGFVDHLICSLVGELSRCLAALPAMRLGDPRAAADHVGVRVDSAPRALWQLASDRAAARAHRHRSELQGQRTATQSLCRRLRLRPRRVRPASKPVRREKWEA